MKTADQKYLRAIYQISLPENHAKASISELAHYLALKPPTVLERLKQLQAEKLLTYNKSKGIHLSKLGQMEALRIVRKHRVWETFLHRICKFSWSEVHELAEQLQNVDSDILIDRIYHLSGEPQFDPHGDPIPNKQGILPVSHRRPLLQSVEGCRCLVLGVNEDSTDFLNYLTELKIGLNQKLHVEKIFAFDGSIKVRPPHHHSVILSAKVAEQIMVSCSKLHCACKKQ